MKAMIVRFDFSAGPGRLDEWRRYVAEESVPRFERHAGLRHKLFLWEDDPPAAVAVYLFADDAAFEAYAAPLLDGSGGVHHHPPLRRARKHPGAGRGRGRRRPGGPEGLSEVVKLRLSGLASSSGHASSERSGSPGTRHRGGLAAGCRGVGAHAAQLRRRPAGRHRGDRHRGRRLRSAGVGDGDACRQGCPTSGSSGRRSAPGRLDAQLTNVSVQGHAVTFTAVADGEGVCDPGESDTPPANRTWSAGFDVEVGFTQRVGVVLCNRDDPRAKTFAVRPREVRVELRRCGPQRALDAVRRTQGRRLRHLQVAHPVRGRLQRQRDAPQGGADPSGPLPTPQAARPQGGRRVLHQGRVRLGRAPRRAPARHGMDEHQANLPACRHAADPDPLTEPLRTGAARGYVPGS